MQFIAILKPKPEVANKSITPMLKKENAEAWMMVTEGVLRSLWYLAPASGTKEPGGSVCILECADAEEAETQLGRLPLVQSAFVSVELMQLNPFTGFEFLFGQGYMCL